MASKTKPTHVYWLDDSLYLNITNKCSSNCWFCFRNYKNGVGGFNLKLSEEPKAADIIFEIKNVILSRSWKEVVFCGFGEPTAQLDVLLEISKWLKSRYPSLPVRLDTNGHGYFLNPSRNVASELKEAGVSRVSVSLNGQNSDSYDENCRPTFKGGFDSVLGFVRKASLAGLQVEVTAVRMPEVDVRAVREIVEKLGVPFRVRDYIPCFW